MAARHSSEFKVERDKTEMVSECVRIWIPLLIVVYPITIENDCCVLRDVHSVVYKVFCRIVRRWYPKRRSDALYLRIQFSIEKEAMAGVS